MARLSWPVIRMSVDAMRCSAGLRARGALQARLYSSLSSRLCDETSVITRVTLAHCVVELLELLELLRLYVYPIKTVFTRRPCELRDVVLEKSNAAPNRC